MNVGGGVDFPEKEGKLYDGPWTAPVSKEDIVKQFKGWESDVQGILKVSPLTLAARLMSATHGVNSISTEAYCGPST